MGGGGGGASWPWSLLRVYHLTCFLSDDKQRRFVQWSERVGAYGLVDQWRRDRCAARGGFYLFLKMARFEQWKRHTNHWASRIVHQEDLRMAAFKQSIPAPHPPSGRVLRAWYKAVLNLKDLHLLKNRPAWPSSVQMRRGEEYTNATAADRYCIHCLLLQVPYTIVRKHDRLLNEEKHHLSLLRATRNSVESLLGHGSVRCPP
jgi:hypothetical protein